MKNKFRAALSLMLCIVFTATALVPCVTAFADGREIIASGTSGDISWLFYSDGELRFEGDGTLANTKTTRPTWDNYISQVRKISIGAGVNAANESCFNSMLFTQPNFYTSLEEISIDSGNTCFSLDENGVLYNFDKTALILFPVNLKMSDYYVCESTESIADGAFSYASGLTKVDLGDKLKTIGQKAFYYCENIERVELSDTLLKIDKYAFYNCNKLESVSLPDCLEAIEECAFMQCGSLTEITVPSKITAINKQVFRTCKKLKKVSLPDGIKNIGDYAFAYCLELNNVTIPHSVTSLGIECFEGCRSLTSIEIPDSVTSIRRSAFTGCNELSSVKLPTNLKTLDSATFYGCKSLSSINLPDSLQTISTQAFSGCPINSISIPSKVSSIGSTAFERCTQLKSINVSESNPYFSDKNGVLFNEDITELICYPAGKEEASYEIPDTVKKIGQSAFDSAQALINISAPRGIEFIGADAFSGTGFYNDAASWDNGFLYLNTYLIEAKNVASECKVYSKTTLIASNAFESSSVTSVEMPDCVEHINTYAFYKCSKLKSINISDNLKSIGNYAFYYCTNLERVEIPSGVTTINNRVFSNCTALKEVVIHGMITEIGEYSFGGTTNLKKIIIPETVKSLDSTAFSSSGITDIYYGDSKAQWKRLANGATFNKATVHYTLRSEDESVIINHTDSNFNYEAGNVHLVVEDLGNATSSYEQNGFYNNLLVKPIQVLDITLVDGDGNPIQPLSEEKITVKIKASDEFMNLMKSGLASVSDYDVEASEINFADDCFVLEIDGETVSVPAPEKFLKKFKIIHWYSDAVKPTDHEGFKHDEITVENGYIILETNHFSEYAVCTDLTALEEHSVKWIVDGVSTEQTVTEGDVISAPENPEKEGYTFVGWTPEVPETMPAENLEFTAVWQANEYTITFDTAGGSEIAPITLEYGAAITAPATPEKEGYTFIGWTPEIPETMPANDITVVAQYKKDEASEEPEKPAAALTGIDVISPPFKTQYAYKADSLDLSGITVKLTYSDGTSKILTDTGLLKAYGFNADSIGTKKITVAYGSYTDDFEITVSYSWWQWIIRIFLFGFMWY